MKTAKLVSSIVSMALAAAGIIYELITHAENFSGKSCWLVAILMIAAGIIGIFLVTIFKQGYSKPVKASSSTQASTPKQ